METDALPTLSRPERARLTSALPFDQEDPTARARRVCVPGDTYPRYDDYAVRESRREGKHDRLGLCSLFLRAVLQNLSQEEQVVGLLTD